MNQTIVGAGLAGLIAACHFKDSVIIDAAPGPGQKHQALLRFRCTSVAELTGIPFKKVTVQKAVCHDGNLLDHATIRHSNAYAYKVTGSVIPRSIDDLEPCERFIAPDDFYDQLIARHGNRIRWGAPFDQDYLQRQRSNGWGEIISTAPMSVNLAAAAMHHGGAFGTNSKAPIRVWRCKLKCPSDVYQTIYFPDPTRLLFRASITGDTLIVESLLQLPDGRASTGLVDYRNVWEAFGLHESQLDLAAQTETTQPFGKIVDMEKGHREALMHELTNVHGIYSLGRFATWRNILLDDVVHDIERIDRLIHASEYGRKLLSSK